MEWKNYQKIIDDDITVKYDLTRLFSDAKTFRTLINDIEALQKVAYDKIASMEATGWPIAAAIASRNGKGLIPIRKGGHSASTRVKKATCSDGTELEIWTGAVRKGDRVLIIDSWVETGAQTRGAITLLERLGATVVGISVLGAERTERTETLFTEHNLRAVHVAEKNKKMRKRRTTSP